MMSDKSPHADFAHERFEKPLVYVPLQTAAASGIGFGSCLAMVISWSVNKSVFWAIIQGVFGWGYVLYYLLTHHG